jgi:hypothetical protein
LAGPEFRKSCFIKAPKGLVNSIADASDLAREISALPPAAAMEEDNESA